MVFQGRKPSPFAGGGVEFRQHDQSQGAVIALGGGGQLLDRGAALLARFARGDAHLHDLLVGKQAERAARGQYLAPVEMGT